MSITWRQWYISYYFQFAFHSIATIENHFITSCHSFMGFAFHSQVEGEQTNLQSWTQISKNCPTFLLGPATLAIHPSARAMLGRPSRALVPLVGFGMFIIRTKVLNAILSPYRQRYSLGLGCARSQSHLEKAVEDDGHQHSRRSCHRPDDFDL